MQSVLVDESVEALPRRWETVPLLLVVTPLLGAAIGVLTNLINLAVCAQYFAIVLRVSSRTGVVWLGVVHGLVEGGALGLLFGIVFAIATAATSGFRCPPRAVARVLLVVAAFAVACWALGGAAGATLAALDPASFQAMFPPSSLSRSVVRFAWVGGSIWGGYAGAVLGAILGSVLFHRAWREARRRPGFAVLSSANESGADASRVRPAS